jgi:hypothetical protein
MLALDCFRPDFFTAVRAFHDDTKVPDSDRRPVPYRSS